MQAVRVDMGPGDWPAWNLEMANLTVDLRLNSTPSEQYCMIKLMSSKKGKAPCTSPRQDVAG